MTRFVSAARQGDVQGGPVTWDPRSDLRLLVISVLLSTTSCPSKRMSLTAVCQAGYNQLRQLRSVVRSLSVHATKTLVQAFISCRLDYCNSLLYGINDGLPRRLQSVQNASW